VLPNFKALHNVKSSSKIEFLRNVLRLKALGRDEKRFRLDISAVHSQIVRDAQVAVYREPGASAASNVKHTLRRQFPQNQRNHMARRAHRPSLNIAIKGIAIAVTF